MIALSILIHLMIPQSLAQSPLDGLWKQDCRSNTIRTESFAGPSVTLEENYFTDAACTKPIMQFKNTGTYIVINEQMDFRFVSVSTTLQMDAMVDDFNRRQVCGFTDWKINEEKELAGLICRFFNEATNTQVPKTDDMRYGIYKIKADYLFLGQLTPTKNALTPEARPTEWNLQFYIKAQE